jgi:cytochrome c
MRLALAVGLALTSARAGAQADAFGGLPEGEGRRETYANCTPCHSTMIIRQQRLARRTWHEVLTWMVEEKGMRELAPEVRARVLDYLATHFGADAPR